MLPRIYINVCIIDNNSATVLHNYHWKAKKTREKTRAEIIQRTFIISVEANHMCPQFICLLRVNDMGCPMSTL